MSWKDRFIMPLDQGGDGEPVAANSFDQVGAPAGAPVRGVPLYYFCVVDDLPNETDALKRYVRERLRGIILNEAQFLNLLQDVQFATFNLIIVAHGEANNPALYRRNNARAQFIMNRDGIIDALNDHNNTVTIYPCICENLQGVQSTSRGTVLWEGYATGGVNIMTFIRYLYWRNVMGTFIN